MSALLKFIVTMKATDPEGNVDVMMEPVIDGNEENEKFWEFTPVGRFTFGVTNNSANFIEEGQEYYITITSNNPLQEGQA